MYFLAVFLTNWKTRVGGWGWYVLYLVSTGISLTLTGRVKTRFEIVMFPKFRKFCVNGNYLIAFWFYSLFFLFLWIFYFRNFLFCCCRLSDENSLLFRWIRLIVEWSNRKLLRIYHWKLVQQNGIDMFPFCNYFASHELFIKHTFSEQVNSHTWFFF